jgi:hypothetical protein
MLTIGERWRKIDYLDHLRVPATNFLLGLCGCLWCGLFAAGLSGCVPTTLITGTGERFDLAEEIQPGKSTRHDVEALLGTPRYSSAEWGVEVFHREDYARRIFVYWGVWPGGHEKLDQYLIVTYSESGVVLGVRSVEDVGCDARCGGIIKLGSRNGLDLVQPGILLASREDSTRLASTDPAFDECVVYAVPFTHVYDVPVYLDGYFLQKSQPKSYFRLTVTPGEHLLSCWINDQLDRWSSASSPGHPLVESNYQTHTDWPISCSGGTTLRLRIDLKKRSWWRAPQDCAISVMSNSDAADEIAVRRMIIPFDPVEHNTEPPERSQDQHLVNE